MPDTSAQWHLQPNIQPPDWFLKAVKQQVPAVDGSAIAQLLWQRGLRDPVMLPGFLNPNDYQPASPFDFGEEMVRAVQRIQHAIAAHETVAIWGDFDADGVTATSVLWDGLGQFFVQQKTLLYYIPNRLTESHGLSQQGIDHLHRQGCQLMVTCDTGSTNLTEIQYALTLGIDVIVTDHHTLPDTRPPVSAIINPRSLPPEHPLATLSGVAVAYKLVEALYETLPDLPQKPQEELLDLVAIGLIADLVELKGDCRYLAQRGIEQLQKQANLATATRPGVAKLLEFCKRSGDRPTDISFGVGPRINAVSRIQGDAHFCVELLTSQDKTLCTHLAEATELANARRKALQKDVLAQVKQRLAQCDFSTTRVIVLADEQWQPGVLGLVAGQIAQEYGRPTILLQTETGQAGHDAIARGSARSVNNIDLYQLVKDQAHLLHRFGGHPYAAGLSLLVDNIPLFAEAINQQLRQSQEGDSQPSIQADLVVTVAELGKELFQELKLLEPCGIGNPVPRLLLENCWFSNVQNRKIKDRRGQKLEYIKTEFELWDDSCQKGFPGVWWGHYRDEIPEGQCDVIVELDHNSYVPRYEVRIIAVRLREKASSPNYTPSEPWILDWRNTPVPDLDLTLAPLVIHRCPTSWQELQVWFRRAEQEQRPLAIAFTPPINPPPMEIWQQLVGIAKYLSRTGKTATRQQFLEKLGIGDLPLQLGFKTLALLGFVLTASESGIQIRQTGDPKSDLMAFQPMSEDTVMQAVKQFLISVKEEEFRRRYFFQVPLTMIQAIAEHSLLHNSSNNRINLSN